MVSAQPANRLYAEIVEVTKDYLGPAAQRFVDRQVVSHLNKPPEKLTQNDVLKLVDWSRAAMSLLTDDKNIVNNYVENLMRLTHKRT